MKREARSSFLPSHKIFSNLSCQVLSDSHVSSRVFRRSFRRSSRVPQYSVQSTSSFNLYRFQALIARKLMADSGSSQQSQLSELAVARPKANRGKKSLFHASVFSL